MYRVCCQSLHPFQLMPANSWALISDGGQRMPALAARFATSGMWRAVLGTTRVPVTLVVSGGFRGEIRKARRWECLKSVRRRRRCNARDSITFWRLMRARLRLGLDRVGEHHRARSRRGEVPVRGSDQWVGRQVPEQPGVDPASGDKYSDSRCDGRPVAQQLSPGVRYVAPRVM